MSAMYSVYNWIIIIRNQMLLPVLKYLYWLQKKRWFKAIDDHVCDPFSQVLNIVFTQGLHLFTAFQHLPTGVLSSPHRPLMMIHRGRRCLCSSFANSLQGVYYVFTEV